MRVTTRCGDACPYVPELKREDWPIEESKSKSAERVRQIRDEVRFRITALLRREDWVR